MEWSGEVRMEWSGEECMEWSGEVQTYGVEW